MKNSSRPSLGSVFPRRLMINGGSILAGEASARATTFLVAVVVARVFGPVALGQYGCAVAITSILLLLPDAGLHLFIVRELAASPERLRPVYWGAHWLKLPPVAAILAFPLFFGVIGINDPGRRVLLYVLLLKIVLQTFSQASMAVFKAFERMHYVAIQQFANAFLAALCVGAALFLHSSVAFVVMALVAGQALETAIGWRFMQEFFQPGAPCPPKAGQLWMMLVSGAPIGFAAVLQALNLRLDILTLSPFATNIELGGYQAAAWFPLGAFLLVSLVMTTLFPKLARLLRDPGKHAGDYVSSLLKVGVPLLTVASIIVGLFAPFLLHLVFGPKLVLAPSALRILVIALPLIFVNTALFHVCVAAQKRSAYLTALLLGGVAGGGLSVLLSARFGPDGTAVAFVLRELIVSAVYLGFLNAGELAGSATTLLRILACCSGGLMILVVLLGNSRAFGIAWSVAVMIGVIVFLLGCRPQEFRLLVDDKI